VTSFVSVALAEYHKLDEFDCGIPSLNEWLFTQAMRARGSGTAKTYVWTEAESDRAVAYYSIAPHQVHRAEVSSGSSGGVTNVPAYLLARLALDEKLHERGFGGQLLRDALERIVAAADVASGRLIVVDAIDDQAAAFYRKFDFRPVKDNPLRLVIKIATVRKALSG
jgi:GNAT superfamily N-acetyltransferase